MNIQQIAFEENSWSKISEKGEVDTKKIQLVLAFGERKCLEAVKPYEYLRSIYTNAEIVISYTAGEIYHDKVYSNTIIVTAIEFDKVSIKTTQLSIENHLQSSKVGLALAQNLIADDLTSLFILLDGSRVNGSDLISALNEETNNTIPISGGLAGDEARFERTLVGLNQNPEPGQIVGIGFYGENLKVGHGTMGGWEGFGPEREVTKSEFNILYRIGDKAALDIYKEYLGKYANELPGAALLFPLSMRVDENDQPVVRTILSIDEENKSMTFAGDIPQGSFVRFMKANLDRIIDASATAALGSIEVLGKSPELAILVSCVGRKLVLGERTEEEVEAARDIFGDQTIITGFYSYGEISTHKKNNRCELHNQTMTITTFSEL